MRKLSALGMALMIGGGLVAGAVPARAQELDCRATTDLFDPEPVCALVNRQIAHVNEELGYAMAEVYELYDWTDRTVRCVVFQQCP